MPGAGGSPEGETLHDQSRGSGRYRTTGLICSIDGEISSGSIHTFAMSSLLKKTDDPARLLESFSSELI